MEQLNDIHKRIPFVAVCLYTQENVVRKKTRQQR